MKITLLLVISFWFLVLGSGNSVLATGNQQEYEPAPDFTLSDIEGNEVTLSELLETGPVYMDALLPVYDSLKERGLQIVALSVDKPSDEARVRAFVKSKKWPYIVLLDQQQKVKKAYNIIIKPTAFLINMQGEIVYTHIGYKKGDEKRIADEMGKWLPEKQKEPEPKGTEPGQN
jgi:peroxiredoxin